MPPVARHGVYRMPRPTLCSHGPTLSLTPPSCTAPQEEARQAIVASPEMVERIRYCRQWGTNDLVKAVARGCLFTLGLEEHTLTSHALRMHQATYSG